MLGQEEAFTHLSHGVVGDASTRKEANTLVLSLRLAGALRAPRARLYRSIPHPAFRQVLAIDLDLDGDEESFLKGKRGLWLVEQSDRKVFLYAARRLDPGASIGGRVLPGRAVLHPTAAWLDDVAAVSVYRLCRSHPQARLFFQIEINVLRAALSAFVAGLDTAVLEAVRAEGRPTLEVYNHYWSGSETVCRNRLQGAQCFPLFSDALREDWRLRRRVDGGAPLTHNIADRYHIQQRTVQRTRSVLPSRVPAVRKVTILKRLDQLPPEYFPQQPDDWDTFRHLSDGLCDLAEILQVDYRRLAAPFAKGWRQGYTDLSRKLGSELNLAAIFEMMQAAYRYGLVPALLAGLQAAGRSTTVYADPPSRFFPLWFGRYGLRKLAEMGQRWRLAYQQFSLNRLNLGEPGSALTEDWPSLCDKAASHGPYRVVELTSRQDLELEGRKQQHCVASYAVKCLLGDSSIFSLRDRFDNTLSTFEVGLANHRPILRMHLGHRNQAVGGELQAVVARFIEQVLAAVPAARIDTVRQARRAIGGRISGQLSAPNTFDDPLTVKEWAELAEMIAFAHPHEAKRIGLLAFAEQQGLVESEPIP